MPLEHLFQRMPPLSIDTIRGYRSALSSTLYNMVDLTNSVFLRNLFKNMDLQRPKYKEFCLKWNLALVLAYITSPPFEPIMKVSLWHLTLKTVFSSSWPQVVTETSFMPFPAMRSAIVSGPTGVWLPSSLNQAEPGCSLILKSLKATFHRRTSPSGSRNWSRMPMSMLARCQPTMSGFFRHLGQHLTVGCLHWAPMWQHRQSSSLQARLRMRKRAYTLLSPSSHPEIESADSHQLFMKRDRCFFCWVSTFTLNASIVFPAEK